MASQTRLWGPVFEHYSPRPFEPYPSQAVRREFIANGRRYDIPDVKSLESALCMSIIQGETHESRMEELNEPANILKKYLAYSQTKIFAHYYGFLVVRLLLHTGFFSLPGSDDDLYNPLTGSGRYHELSQSKAFRTIEHVIDNSLHTTMLAKFHVDRAAPGNNSGGSGMPLIIHTLWEDRGSFLKLCSTGLLPGACTFLLTGLLLAEMRTKAELHVDMLRLKELLFRVYLVGSNMDRRVVQEVCPDIAKLTGPTEIQPGRSDPQDSRFVHRAYAGLLFAMQTHRVDLDPKAANVVLLLSEYTLSVVMSNKKVQFIELNDVAIRTIDYIWLLLERPALISLNDWTERILHVTSQVFHLIWVVFHSVTPVGEGLIELERLVKGCSLVSYIARVLFLVAETESDSWLEDLLRSVDEMCGVIEECATMAPEVFIRPRIDWTKSRDHLRFLMAGTYLKRKEIAAKELLTWANFGRSIGARDHKHSESLCAYSRCESGYTQTPYMCARCRTAAYCSRRCQTTHWRLGNVESHKIECQPCGD